MAAFFVYLIELVRSNIGRNMAIAMNPITAPIMTISGENQQTILGTLNSCREFIVGQDINNYRSIAYTIKSAFWHSRPQGAPLRWHSLMHTQRH